MSAVAPPTRAASPRKAAPVAVGPGRHGTRDGLRVDVPHGGQRQAMGRQERRQSVQVRRGPQTHPGVQAVDVEQPAQRSEVDQHARRGRHRGEAVAAPHRLDGQPALAGRRDDGRDLGDGGRTGV